MSLTSLMSDELPDLLFIANQRAKTQSNTIRLAMSKA